MLITTKIPRWFNINYKRFAIKQRGITQKNYSMRKIANKFGVNIATISRKFIRCEKDNYILF